ncbi:MAG TPA: protein kinase [Polyangiaceae bacterium]
MPKQGGDEPTASTVAAHVLERPPTPAELGIAKVLLPDRFVIKGILGRGGMGVVFEVHDKQLNRDVAVKLLPSETFGDPQMRGRFMREARAAGTLDHPGIVTVHDVDVEAGFIVMELVRGESLHERLKREKRLPPAEVRRIGTELLRALSAAHAASIVHRDVKPANILIDGFGMVKLVDFGVASFGDSDLTSTGMRIGTPSYMAPEQLRGRTSDPRADVYSVGATLFEAATGVKLHGPDGPADDPQAVVRRATGDDDLAAAIGRAVSERVDRRFASAAEFEAALLRPAAPSKLRKGAARAWLAAGAAAVVMSAVASIAWRERGRSTRPVASPETAAGDPSAKRSIAVLPFEDKTGDPQLDFSESGLPYLLEQEFGKVAGIGVVGYYRLRDRIPAKDATLADWRAAARAMGADLVVRGELTPTAKAVHVTLFVEQLSDGRTLATLGADAAVEKIPGAVRALAGDVASAAVGHPVAAPQGTSRPFNVERELQLGIRALEEHDLPLAARHVRAAIALDPSVVEAHYYLALLLWWQESDDARAEIDLALRGDLDETRRGFLQGLQLLIDHLFPQAIAHFKSLDARFPANRDIVYGLVEALFHGGHADEAKAAYRRVVEISPSFRLGFFHVGDHYAAHGDTAGLAWMLSEMESGKTDTQLWDARARLARRDYKGAVDALQQVLERLHVDDPLELTSFAKRDLVAAYAVTGHTTLALGLIEGADDPMSRLALATALGDARAARDARAQVIANLSSSPDGWRRANVWLTLAALDVSAGDPKLAHKTLSGLTAALPPGFVELRVACGRGLLGGFLGTKGLVDDARASEFPEAAAIGEAFTDEAKGDSEGAVGAWRRAASLSADGRFMVPESLFAARAARTAGDHAAVIAACEDAVEPRKFDASWGGAVGPCLLWTAEAQAALGQASDAAASYKRLLAVRTKAPASDPLVHAAQAALARE